MADWKAAFGDKIKALQNKMGDGPLSHNPDGHLSIVEAKNRAYGCILTAIFAAITYEKEEDAEHRAFVMRVALEAAGQTLFRGIKDADPEKCRDMLMGMCEQIGVQLQKSDPPAANRLCRAMLRALNMTTLSEEEEDDNDSDE